MCGSLALGDIGYRAPPRLMGVMIALVINSRQPEATHCLKIVAGRCDNCGRTNKRKKEPPRLVASYLARTA